MRTPQLFDKLKPEVITGPNYWRGYTTDGISWQVYRGDAHQVLMDFPDNSYNCVVTSPPYYWQRDYKVAGQIGQEQTIEAYVKAIADTMDKVHRVLTKDGLLFLNLGDTYYSLSILNTADGRALLRYKTVVSHSRWAWLLKDWIDRRFMARYQQLY